MKELITELKGKRPTERPKAKRAVAVAVGFVAVAAAWYLGRSQPIRVSKLLPAYDFVIVGGGSAGSVLAARLSEDAGVSVLLLEAGGEPGLKHSIPAACGNLQRTETDWSFQSTQQTFSHRAHSGRTSNWPRGKVLGGSSQLNYMAYVRGDAADYDSWAALGNPGWGWEAVLPYFKKSEDGSMLLDGTAAAGGAKPASASPVNASAHGMDGPLSVRFHAPLNPLAQAFVSAGAAAGHPERDYNDGSVLGSSHFQQTVTSAGKRCSAAGALR